MQTLFGIVDIIKIILSESYDLDMNIDMYTMIELFEVKMQ